MISHNESLQLYFIYNLDELEAVVTFYAKVDLSPTVPYRHHSTGALSSSSSSNYSAPGRVISNVHNTGIVTPAEFTLSRGSDNQTFAQLHDRQSHQRSLDILYRLIVINYGSNVLEAIIADVPLIHELHTNPIHALAFSHELRMYVQLRHLPVVSRHDTANYTHPLSGTPVRTWYPLSLPHDRVPNDNTHRQHLHNLNRELNTHLSFSEIHLLLDIPTVQRLHDDVTYVEYLCNIANVRRTLASRIPQHYPSTRETLTHNENNVDDNYMPVSTQSRALKRPVGHQKNAFASSATSSTAFTQFATQSSRAVPAPDIVSTSRAVSAPDTVSTTLFPRVAKRAVKSRPAMSRTQDREWQLLRRYDMYTNIRTLANQPYNTYYTWLSSYNADDYSSDEIVDNDTDSDSHESNEEVESDDNDNANDAPPSLVIPVIPPPNPFVTPPVPINNLDALVNTSVARTRHIYIDLTMRNNLTSPSIHTRVFHDHLSPPAHNTRAQLTRTKQTPRSPTPTEAKPSGQPSFFSLR